MLVLSAAVCVMSGEGVMVRERVKGIVMLMVRVKVSVRVKMY